MNNTRLTTLLMRYLRGRTSPAEEAELFDYIGKDDNEHLARMLEEVWNQPEHHLTPEKSQQILDRILLTETESPDAKPAQTSWLRIAASIATIATAGFIFYQYAAPKISPVGKMLAEEVSAHQFIKLPDGSTVLLNSGSTLDYPEVFDGPTREVTLSGEAFFDIKHNAARPFIVRTGSLTTTVLGTSFNVKAYAADDNITVTVTSGRVKVSDEMKVLGIIDPNQQISFSKATQQSEQKEVKSEEVVAWAEKDIFFDDVTLSEAVMMLEERFDVDIQLDQAEIGDCRFTATFVRGEDLYQILDVICAFNTTTWTEVDTDTIRVIGAGCGTIDQKTDTEV